MLYPNQLPTPILPCLSSPREPLTCFLSLDFYGILRVSYKWNHLCSLVMMILSSIILVVYKHKYIVLQLETGQFREDHLLPWQSHLVLLKTRFSVLLSESLRSPLSRPVPKRNGVKIKKSVCQYAMRNNKFICVADHICFLLAYRYINANYSQIVAW